jgi:hypothetical protein
MIESLMISCLEAVFQQQMCFHSAIPGELIQHAHHQSMSTISAKLTLIERSGLSRSAQLSTLILLLHAMLMSIHHTTTITACLILVPVILAEIANACVLLSVLMLRNAIDMESIFTGETSSFALFSVMAVDLTIHVLVLVQSLAIITITGHRLKPHAQILVLKAVLATMSM